MTEPFNDLRSCGELSTREAATPIDHETRRDLKTLATFIQLFCDTRHEASERGAPTLRGVDPREVVGRELTLCEDCRKLLQHAFFKRMRCPYDPKPMCKKCPSHCYAPKYREKIREVMRCSGRRMVLGGRLDYLWHLLF